MRAVVVGEADESEADRDVSVNTGWVAHSRLPSVHLCYHIHSI